MNEKLAEIIKNFLPEGSVMTKAYQEGGELRVEIKLPDGGGDVTCTLKKNHAGEFFLE